MLNLGKASLAENHTRVKVTVKPAMFYCFAAIDKRDKVIAEGAFQEGRERLRGEVRVGEYKKIRI